MTSISRFFFVLLSAAFCNGEYLMSKNSWKIAADFLPPKDDHKMSLTNQNLSKISAYENVKEKVCRENKKQWGFFRHLKTGEIFVIDDFKILPPDWSYMFSMRTDIHFDEIRLFRFNFNDYHVETNPFIRCVNRHLDLSKLFDDAIIMNRFFLVESLIDAGFEVNNAVKEMRKTIARDRPADFLVNAIEKWDNGLTRALSEVGDVHAGNDDYGDTALHVAAFGNNANVMEILMKNGADIEVRNRLRETALHRAATANSVEAVQLLIENNVEIEARDMYEETPYHKAAVQYNEKVVEILITNGANREARNYNGTVIRCTKCGKKYCERGEVQNILRKRYSTIKKYFAILISYLVVISIFAFQIYSNEQ